MLININFNIYLYNLIKMQEGNITNKITSLSNPVTYIPKMMFFTKGKGIHKDYLTSFELALRDASISDLNLVSVSSIKPPQCKIVSRQEGRKYLMPDQEVFTVLPPSPPNDPIRLMPAPMVLAGLPDVPHHHGNY